MSYGYGYAVARLRAMERRFLDGAVLQRMVEAEDYGQALKVLAETVYGGLLTGEEMSPASLERARRWFARFGWPSLLFAWLPVAGDPLTFAAGTLNYPLGRFLLLVLAGKAATPSAAVSVWTRGASSVTPRSSRSHSASGSASSAAPVRALWRATRPSATASATTRVSRPTARIASSLPGMP